jgi:cell division inhibitor SulA
VRGGRGAALLAALLAAGLLLLGCGAEEAEAPRERSPERAPAVLPEPRLARGDFELSVEDGRVSVAANDAALGPLLARLSQEAGFELTVLAPELPPVRVALRGATLPVALVRLLEGLDYRTDFRVDSDSGRSRLVQLRVGPEPAAASPERPVAPAERRAEREPDRERARADWRRVRSERRAARSEEQAQQIERLASRDPVVRAEAAEDLEPEGEGLRRLADLARHDPDPDVRVAAIETLEDADAHAAVQALVDALADPDPRVVVAAIEALEFAGDETVVPYLQPLRESPDAEIGDAAAEAIEFLE